jgi:four helix bundle protein
MFDTLEMSLTVLEQLAPVEAKIRQRRKSLADEVGRAAESVALNVSEARQRAGLDRADLFRRAAGSASELTTALRIARARGYITQADHAAVDATLDRVRAMLWRLTIKAHGPASAFRRERKISGVDTRPRAEAVGSTRVRFGARCPPRTLISLDSVAMPREALPDAHGCQWLPAAPAT